jgi:hypothetical protein
MICTAEGSSTSQLVIAPLELGQLTLGPETVLASGLPGAPAWSPDGTGLVYFAPLHGQTGPFQMYYVRAQTNGMAAPRAVTVGDAFDSTAAPAWYG